MYFDIFFEEKWFFQIRISVLFKKTAFKKQPFRLKPGIILSISQNIRKAYLSSIFYVSQLGLAIRNLCWVFEYFYKEFHFFIRKKVQLNIPLTILGAFIPSNDKIFFPFFLIFGPQNVIIYVYIRLNIALRRTFDKIKTLAKGTTCYKIE